MTDYILLKAAERYLERMQLDDQVRIFKALDALVADPIPQDLILNRSKVVLSFACEWVNIEYSS